MQRSKFIQHIQASCWMSLMDHTIAKKDVFSLMSFGVFGAFWGVIFQAETALSLAAGCYCCYCCTGSDLQSRLQLPDTRPALRQGGTEDIYRKDSCLELEWLRKEYRVNLFYNQGWAFYRIIDFVFINSQLKISFR